MRREPDHHSKVRKIVPLFNIAKRRKNQSNASYFVAVAIVDFFFKL